MTRVIFIFLSAALAVSCTTATLHNKNGRFDGRYSLHLARFTGPMDSAEVYDEIRAGFVKEDIVIDSASPRRITCWCDLAYERKEYVLFGASSYIASVRCASGDTTFYATAKRTLPERFFTTAAAIGILAESNVPWYAIAGGLAVDLVLVPGSATSYQAAVEKAVMNGLDSRKSPKPTERQRR